MVIRIRLFNEVCPAVYRQAFPVYGIRYIVPILNHVLKATQTEKCNLAFHSLGT